MRYIKVKFSDGKIRKVPFFEPMRPVDTKEIPDDYTGWIVEEKIDGSVTLMYLIDGAVAFLNRRATNKTPVYPDLVRSVRGMHPRGLTIIEGEAYALGGGTDSFEQFLKRDLLQNPQEAQRREKEIPLRFKAFDIVMVEGKDIRKEPILDRKKELRKVLPKNSRISASSYSTNPKEFTKKMKKDKTVEGVVFKALPDGFVEGKSPQWKKLKFKKEADTVVMGYEKGQGRRKDIGALRVGVYDKGKVKEVANVGTGFTDEELSDIKKRLDKGEKLFAKVQYMKVCSQGRLRAPVFSGLREDITVKETHL